MRVQCLNQKALLPELIPEGTVAIIIIMMIIISFKTENVWIDKTYLFQS